MMFAAIRATVTRPFLPLGGSVRSVCSMNCHDAVKSPIPYGLANFAVIRKQGLWYVDKTHFLRVVEAAPPNLIFVRPARFGKTLLLSMMSYYYDLKYKDEFDKLFGGLRIHENPTNLRSSFRVLNLDMRIPSHGDLHDNFTRCINGCVTDCCTKYGLDVPSIVCEKDATESMLALARKFRGEKFMILVDEYDRSANEIMFYNPGAYDKFFRGESGDPHSSVFRSFLVTLKKIPEQVEFSAFRSFITGITPLAVADASGYNVAYNVSLSPSFGDIVGFSETDISDALAKYLQLQPDELTRVQDVMRSYYDGYLFPGSMQKLYNSTLVAYFLNKFFMELGFRDKILKSTFKPGDLIDENTRLSEGALNLISKVRSSSEIIFKLTNKQVGATVSMLHKYFTLHELLHPPVDDVNGLDRALSFLFYHGVVTLQSQKDVAPVPLTLPNKLAKLHFLDRLKQVLSLPDKLLYELKRNPSEGTVYTLLNSIVEKQQSLFDNFLSESGLQHMIEAALCAQIGGSTSVQAEVKVGNGRRSDMIIEFPGSRVVLEFKRIRLNALSPPSELEGDYPKDCPKHPNWDCLLQHEVIECLKKCTFDELCKFTIHPDMHRLYGNKKNVLEVLDAGKSQVQGYASRLSKDNSAISCYAFVILQVGYPLIVQKA